MSSADSNSPTQDPNVELATTAPAQPQEEEPQHANQQPENGHRVTPAEADVTKAEPQETTVMNGDTDINKKTASGSPVLPETRVSVKDDNGGVYSLAETRIPISITWSHLSYSVKLPGPSRMTRVKSKLGKQKKKEKAEPAADSSTQAVPEAEGAGGGPTIKSILHDVSGHCQPGQLVGILGSSGAGKTTLLNLLSNRTDLADYSGEIKLNGRPASTQLLKHAVFVQQSDLFFQELTVYEHLTFHADLRLGKDVPVEDRRARVDAIISELGLNDVKDSRIGQVGHGGISGGERRRLTFATEVLSNPSLVLLDEPTSGLDSFLAESIVLLLKQMARNGRTLICTIHQPSSDIYMLFDKVMYLAHGRVAYFGDLNQSLKYFSQLGYDCPTYTNPADFIIKQLSVLPANPQKSKEKIAYICNQWEESKQVENVQREIHIIDSHFTSTTEPTLTTADSTGKVVPGQSPSTAAVATSSSPPAAAKPTKNAVDETPYAASFLQQFSSLWWRASLNTARDPILTKARAAQSIVLGVVIGLIYLRLSNNQKSIQNKMGAIFICIINQSMGGTMGVLNTFTAEVPIFLREHKSRVYSTHAYYLARSIAELPFQLFFPYLFITIVYWMVGLNDNGVNYIEFVLAIILTANTAMSLGYIISAAVPTIQVGLAIAIPIILPFMLFGGLFINENSIPDYFYWLSYLSMFKYGFELCSIIVWGDVTSIGCNSSSEDCAVALNNGQQVLAEYGMDSNNVGMDVGILFALLIGFRLIAYLLLLRRANKKQH